MKKKLLFYNQILQAGNNPNYDTGTKLQYAGLNTGNIVYVDALKKECQYEQELWFDGLRVCNAEQYVGVLPCANMIGLHDVCTEIWSDLIETSGVPVILIGLGAQSTKELDTPAKLVEALPREKINALRKICDKTVSVGVRGAFTAECLDKMHIHNYRIIGCPSLYQDMKGEYQEIRKPTNQKILMNLTPFSILGGQILRIGVEVHADWIMQAIGELPKTLQENKRVEEGHIKSRFPGFEIEAEELEKYIHNHAHIFFEMEDWNDFLDEGMYTFSFGSRFHGNVASLSRGIPSLWITHDSRTQELIDTFDLPHIKADEMNKIGSIDELIARCDYTAFYRQYTKMFREFTRFLEENEIAYKV